MIPENPASGAPCGGASYNPFTCRLPHWEQLMSRPARPLLAALCIAALAALESPAPAQEAKKNAVRQKNAVYEKLKKADFDRSAVAETEHFLVATTLPPEKAKALGVVLDKVVPVARRALQYEEKEEAWKGKLAVYYLPDGRDFKSFIRSVVGVQPGGIHYELRGDEPFVVDPADVPAKATEADQFAGGAAVVARAYLKAKGASAALPDWLVGGFGRVTAMRAEGLTSKRYLAHKAAARALANRGAKPTELWGETKPASADLLANSFAEYLAYGPGAANFTKLITGFRPDDNGNPPSPQAAFEAAGWKDWTMLEAAWRKWAATGK
jgi:hypothetical protein